MTIDKHNAIEAGLKVLTEKEQVLKKLIADTRESNNDTKSSMGDKYETSREMLQQEINMLEKQLAEIANQKHVFQKIRAEKANQVALGALVNTSLGNFFISGGIGELNIQEQKIMTISLSSPLAKALTGKKEGDNFVVNGKTHQVYEVH